MFKRNSFYFLFFIFYFFSCSSNNVTTDESLKKYFDQYHVTGTFGMFNNGQAQFQLTAANVQQFVIQASTDLTNWVAIGTNTMAVSGSSTISDAQAASFTNRFYRAVETP